MTSENTLYVRGMDSVDSDESDIWDDSLLINAYDKAQKMANIEVAKRIAMGTNTKKKEKSESEAMQETSKKKKNKTQSKTKAAGTAEKKIWKEGSACRAVYAEDGLEYEAYIYRIVGDDCIVKFLGYDNTDLVSMSSLKPTLGEEARSRQIQEASTERNDDGFESQLASDGAESPSVLARSQPAIHQKKKSHKKKNKSGNAPVLPNIPLPDMEMLRNLGGFAPMAPPPPPAYLSGSFGRDPDEDALSSMMLSWYMNGYYTGLYEGMKRAKKHSESSSLK